MLCGIQFNQQWKAKKIASQCYWLRERKITREGPLFCTDGSNSMIQRDMKAGGNIAVSGGGFAFCLISGQ